MLRTYVRRVFFGRTGESDPVEPGRPNNESRSTRPTREALFEFIWCPLCGQEIFTYIPFEGVFCKNCNTQVLLQESREKRGYEEAVLACFDTDATWNLHVDEKLRRDLPDGSARVKILGAPGAYEVDWWSPAPGEEWKPIERGEFDGVEEPDEVSHLA